MTALKYYFGIHALYTPDLQDIPPSMLRKLSQHYADVYGTPPMESTNAEDLNLIDTIGYRFDRFRALLQDSLQVRHRFSI